MSRSAVSAFVRKICLVVVLCLGQPGASHAYQGELPPPANLPTLTSEAGQQRLLETAYRRAYWPLSAQFETQKSQAYCSVASSVIVLNALGVDRPATSLYPDYPYFTQQDFFVRVDPRVASPAGVEREGMTLEQLAQVLKGFGVDVATFPAAAMTLEQFRNLLQESLQQASSFLLMNYDRRVIGEIGGGHWSPLAAYHPASDSVLILDVARYKYPPVWAPLKDLWAAGKSPDSVSGTSRGLLIVRRP